MWASGLFVRGGNELDTSSFLSASGQRDSRAALGGAGGSSLYRNESGTAQADTSFQVPQRARSGGDSDSDSRSPIKL